MAKIGVFETSPRKWFPFDSDTEVNIEYIDKARVNTILMNGAEAAKKMKAKSGAIQDVYLGKAAVHGWRKVGGENHPGFLLPNGDPIPFSPENRNMLMTKSQQFSEFVYRTCTDENKFLEDDSLLNGDDLVGLDELLLSLEKEEENLGKF